jgi:hypothetical protein
VALIKCQSRPARAQVPRLNCGDLIYIRMNCGIKSMLHPSSLIHSTTPPEQQAAATSNLFYLESLSFTLFSV